MLIGDDALEAHVGHLAALSGGEIFLATDDAASALHLAFATMRRPHDMRAPIEGALIGAEACLGGMRVRADRTPSLASDNTRDEEFERAVGAVAASLAIPRMAEADAAALAEAEGIVCHLTSLVLVDEAGVAQKGIPAQRKVPIMMPSGSLAALQSAIAPVSAVASFCESLPTPNRRHRADLFGAPGLDPAMSFRELAQLVNWSLDPDRLRRGDFAGLPDVVVEALERIASTCREVIDLATNLGQSPLLTALALLALAADSDRNAARLARSILAQADAASLTAARRALALSNAGA